MVSLAVKDPSLDPAIIEAARAEFQEHGFQKASLHKIADRAGITTGALYTRYRNKDALFRSLVVPALEGIRDQLPATQALYDEARQHRDRKLLMKAICQEEQIYLDLLYEHYEDCVLLFCKSTGSSIDAAMSRLMSQKARQTVEFFRSIATRPLDCDGIQLIISNQFFCYRQILDQGCSKEKARSCLQTLNIFLEAGWEAIFDQLF